MSLRRRPFILALIAVLVVTACGGKKDATANPCDRAKPTYGSSAGFTQLGDNLSVTVYEMKVADHFYYKLPKGEETYLITPSDPGHKVAAIFAQVRNHGSSMAFLDLNGKALSVRDCRDKDYPIVDPATNPKLAPNVPRGESPLLTMWGKNDMAQGYGIVAWSFYEMPNSVYPTQLRWDQIDTIFVPFTVPVK